MNSPIHGNAAFPSDANRTATAAAEQPVLRAHRHIAAPRVERQTMTLDSRKGQPRQNNTQRPRAEGHDAALSSVQNRAQPVTITRLNGTTITGIIVRRDRFTVTMERSLGGNTMVHSIIYKHAIDTIDLPQFDKTEVK